MVNIGKFGSKHGQHLIKKSSMVTHGDVTRVESGKVFFGNKFDINDRIPGQPEEFTEGMLCVKQLFF